jgi:hypothetical protein
MKHDCRRLWFRVTEVRILSGLTIRKTCYNTAVKEVEKLHLIVSKIVMKGNVKESWFGGCAVSLFSTMMRLALRYASGTRMYPASAFKRCLATIAEEQSPALGNSLQKISSKLFKQTNRGALRPTMGIPVKPEHGLYHFFRKVIKEDSLTGYDYVAFESMDDSILGSS